MEKQLKYVLLLSLKEMALMKMATILWNDFDILSHLKIFKKNSSARAKFNEKLQEFEDMVKLKVSKLQLPKLLTKQMMDMIHPIGLRIRKWKEFHEMIFFDVHSNYRTVIGLPYIEKLCWTDTGTIDYRKTAEELMHCYAVDVVSRYILACLYCLEDYIPILWKQLSKHAKEYFHKRKNGHPFLRDIPWPNGFIALCVPDYLFRTSERNLTSFNQYAFEYSADIGNKAGVEYYFQKLTHEERDVSLMRTTLAVANSSTLSVFHDRIFPKQHHLGVFCYLLSLLTPQQRMEACRENPVEVLLWFFHWPWQDLFLENACFFWTFPKSCYKELVKEMRFVLSNSDYNFSEVFQGFFVPSPLDFKKHFVGRNSRTGEIPAINYLHVFFRNEDAEAIKVIFKNVDAADRAEILFHPDTLLLFFINILNGRWNMLEVCLKEATFSTEEKERFKITFRGFVDDIDRWKYEWSSEWMDSQLDKFFKFLD